MNHPALSASLDHDACGVGFIAQLGGEATRDVVQRALVALARLSHRGGVDSDGLSGDGAGLLLPIPRVFFRAQSLLSGISLPETFGLGMTFLPPGRETEARGAIESLAQQTGLRCLGWRDVPVKCTTLGSLAAATMPSIRQCFFESLDAAADIERQLFFLRKRVEADGTAGTYFCSLFTYRGLQGSSDPHAISRFLLGSYGLRFPRALCHFSSALLDEHATQLDDGAAFSLCRAQRRNQHDQREPPLAAGSRAGGTTRTGDRRMVPRT